MSCKTRLPKLANFGGVEFYYESADTSGGQRLVDHAFPNQDNHYVENLGAKNRKWSVKGSISGDNLDKKLRRLEVAFKKGAGLFFHPFLNETYKVYCQTWSINTNKNKLGKVDFTASFVEDKGDPAPFGIFTALSSIVNYIDNLVDTVESVFAAVYSITGTVKGVRDNTYNAYNRLLLGFDNIQSLFYEPDKENYDKAYTNAKTNASSVVLAGGQVTAITTLVDALYEGVADKKILSKALNKAARFSIPETADLTDEGAITNMNIRAMNAALKGIVFGYLAKAVINTEYETQQDANVARLDLADAALGLQMISSLELHGHINNITALVGDRFAELQDDLKPLAIKKYNQSVTSLYAAWDLYQNPEKAEDLIIQNEASHGSYLPNEVRYLVV